VHANSTLCIDDVAGLEYDLAPDAATLISPEDTATGTSTIVNLIWTPATTGNPATEYDVYLGLDGEGFTYYGRQTETSFTTPELEFETTYNWRIRPVNAYGVTPANFCSIYVFSTTREAFAVYPPIYDFPANGALGVSIDADLIWHDNIGEEPTDYDVYFGTSPTPGLDGNIVRVLGIPQTYEPGTLEYFTVYYWQIIPTFSSGGYAPGPVWTFRTQRDPLLPVELSSFTATPLINGLIGLIGLLSLKPE